MRTRISGRAWVAVFVTAGVLATGCDASTDSQEESTSSPAASSTSTDIAASRDAPEVGTCWRIPADRLTPDYWFDDSPQVPCTQPHNRNQRSDPRPPVGLDADLDQLSDLRGLQVGGLRTELLRD